MYLSKHVLFLSVRQENNGSEIHWFKQMSIYDPPLVFPDSSVQENVVWNNLLSSPMKTMRKTRSFRKGRESTI